MNIGSVKFKLENVLQRKINKIVNYFDDNFDVQ